ncbi:hypothetical protein [Arthrobacter sp. CDRTa11]|uniref:hypothetical protein n=1 Tax=Arthrobacter sp. CDRTa11 TaxID=2651199 RepID=UPI0022658487|nr:hypothetical protein [Arthrobacter sp. CDRTa11]
MEKRLPQIELLKLQKSLKASGRRLVMVFEGRDAAGTRDNQTLPSTPIHRRAGLPAAPLIGVMTRC